jgi:hypothetical protein
VWKHQLVTTNPTLSSGASSVSLAPLTGWHSILTYQGNQTLTIMGWYSVYERCKSLAVEIMSGAGEIVTSRTWVTNSELKNLLTQLSEISNVRFRCREKSGGWSQTHMYVTAINADDSIILYDDNNSKRHKVRIANILQFDIDNEFKNFKANLPYEVKNVEQKELVRKN